MRWLRLLACGSAGTAAAPPDTPIPVLQWMAWQLFTWGEGASGRLGTGDEERQYEPRAVELEVREYSLP